MDKSEQAPFSIVVGAKPWNRRIFTDVISRYPGRWHFIESREDLRIENIQTWQPRYLFFLHWSWKVPEEIINSYECVCFHMTDVPFGRGGSPLQNLIQRGYRHTKVTALRMTEEFDAGPVYLKEDLCLEGNAEEIFIRATRLCARMIGRIISEHPTPVAQSGDVIVFKRRKPQESEIPALPSLPALHDFLRMLDADGYPKAFLVHAGFRYEFTRAALYDGRIVADVKITRVEEQPS
ncbi:MAG: methionyl-tRNA formyltransferase [Acidobacteria bacterium]|nr:methionyl-tRNA formyltransferase [Acidobacteriota bacterium]